ncbi:hypothetical protein immuto35A_194 [Flavobacterium phage vB_FspM_immuto_3-5A]|jgi:hypothetical protein|uniref:Uncharacterized protein n=1 Tax=Flavobacterium phage vB_FspM_immuto_2-6A TaxID=2801477 RepID=A0A7T8ES31_9CAUD|nr:hypothetical protein KNV73_gp076 [Flavobacterium phage vB_FspM_immuto_2-6A]QQO91874.1 hypothetical protein immuto26A_195 [Flavobacterium phage vB_FspM_immuto_2-6A]QQO92112.1 hypothetical protein immuto35A_194 [Flavobacterium phage vB_FspM_immuto_3-5A]QQO92350.1 hypothetical protein immuto136C_194 [Flavobacterium phage vB_FspM_immuto_13-6C]
MENFDLKKFLVENKLTTNSKILKENSNTRSADYDFIEPENDPLVTKVMEYLEQNYEEGKDYRYEEALNRLYIYDELSSDAELVDLLADVFEQPQYEDGY